MTHASLSLEGRTAVVTGAARGLGYAHALAMAGRGARVVALDVIDSSDVVAAIEGIGGRAESLIVDLADAGAANDAIARVLESCGDVDVLVNNAGAVRDRMSFNLSTPDWQHVLAVNLSATSTCPPRWPADGASARGPIVEGSRSSTRRASAGCTAILAKRTTLRPRPGSRRSP
jgi:3-oxoacyl-[acyl-carrier protein] reductase